MHNFHLQFTKERMLFTNVRWKINDWIDRNHAPCIYETAHKYTNSNSIFHSADANWLNKRQIRVNIPSGQGGWAKAWDRWRICSGLYDIKTTKTRRKLASIVKRWTLKTHRTTQFIYWAFGSSRILCTCTSHFYTYTHIISASLIHTHIHVQSVIV